MRRIALKNKVSHAEVQKVFKSQFALAKSKIEEQDRSYFENASKEEIEGWVFNFLYLGKVHSSVKLQTTGINKNKLDKTHGNRFKTKD